MQILQTKTTRLEENYYGGSDNKVSFDGSRRETFTDHDNAGRRKKDKLEGFSRRDSLKFFNSPQSADEDYETRVTKVVSILQDTVPNRQWCRADIVRAHRLGGNTSHKSRNGFSKPQPMIVKFTRWSDKMGVLTKGRKALKKKGLTVAGVLTTKQQNTIREYREIGLRAYYKGNRQVVAGPLQYHHINRGSFADAARRGASCGRLKPGDSRHTAYQQGNSGTNVRHQTSRSREEYDSLPYHSEDGNSHWSRGTRHSGDIGPPTGRTITGGTSTTTTTIHGPGNTTTAGVPGTGTRNGTISGLPQTGRTTTVAPTPSRRSTCQPGTPGTSHQ